MSYSSRTIERERENGWIRNPFPPKVGWMDGSLTGAVNQDEVESFFTEHSVSVLASLLLLIAQLLSPSSLAGLFYTENTRLRCVCHIYLLSSFIYWWDIEFVTSSSTIWSFCRVCITVYIWNSERENVVQKRKEKKIKTAKISFGNLRRINRKSPLLTWRGIKVTAQSRSIDYETRAGLYTTRLWMLWWRG